MSLSGAALTAALAEATKKAAADMATKVVVPILASAYGKGHDRKQTFDKARSYSERLTNRIASSKTFLHPEKPRHIRRFYERLEFSGPYSRVKDDLASIGAIGRAVAIIGHAGTGKSTTLKHLCYEAIESGSFFPIFIELRRLTSTINRSGEARPSGIRDAMCRELFGGPADEFGPHLEKVLDSKKAIVFLDGFDEVPRDHRLVLINEFYTLQERHPSSRWILSSRPDNAVSSLSMVYTLTPMPLVMDQIERIVDRFDVNKQLEAEFLTLVRDRLYNEHPSYARNPLLLAVLFITFRSHRRISERQSLFLSEVYEALCQRHDARKDGFERELASKLELDNFTKCVELFAFLSAVKSKLFFNKQDLRETVGEVLTAREIKVPSDAFITDLCQSLSLLVEEGLEYTFVHKSLQEFLSARFIATLPEEKRLKALASVATEPHQSLAVALLHELRPDTIEKELVLPMLNQMLHQGGIIPLRPYLIQVHELLTGRGHRVAVLPPEWNRRAGSLSSGRFLDVNDLVTLLRRIYPDFTLPSRNHSGNWWLDEDGALLSVEKFIARGSEIFESQQNLGLINNLVSDFDPGEQERFYQLKLRIQDSINSRDRTEQNVSTLVDDLLR